MPSPCVSAQTVDDISSLKTQDIVVTPFKTEAKKYLPENQKSSKIIRTKLLSKKKNYQGMPTTFSVIKSRTAAETGKSNNLNITKSISKQKPKDVKKHFDFFYSRTIFRLLVQFYKQEHSKKSQVEKGPSLNLKSK